MSIQDKQEYLRHQILEAKLDTELFMQYMGSKKNQGINIELDQWSMEELQQVVNEFKSQSPQFKHNVNGHFMKIVEQVTTQKVKYEDDLEDEQLRCTINCKPNNHPHILQQIPSIHKIELKKETGFFKIASKTEVWTFIQTDQTVSRKYDDYLWLRNSLLRKYPAIYVPPLQQWKSDDEDYIMRKKVQLNQFLRCICGFTELAKSQILYEFIKEGDYSKFSKYRDKTAQLPPLTNITQIENAEGKIFIDVSQRLVYLKRVNEDYIRKSYESFKKVSNIMDRIEDSMGSICKNMRQLTVELVDMTQQNDIIKQNYEMNHSLKKVLKFLNTICTTTANNIQKQLSLITNFHQHIHITKAQLEEYISFNKKRTNEFNNYLNSKFNLQKKKNRCLDDPTKWDLPPTQLSKYSKINVLEMPKEERMKIMFPRETLLQEECKLWHGYTSWNYDNSFKTFLKYKEKSLMSQLQNLFLSLAIQWKETLSVVERYSQAVNGQ